MNRDEQALAAALRQARAAGNKAAELSAGMALMAQTRLRIREQQERMSLALANDDR